MKQKILIHAVATALTLFIFSSATLLSQEEKREVSGFNEISFSLPGELIIEQGNTESLVIRASDEDLQKIITKVEGDHLKIYTKQGSNRLGKVTVLVTVKELSELSLAGSGDVQIKGQLKTQELEISVSGSGDVSAMDVRAREMEISLAGSGDVELGGALSNELEISIAGSGDVDASGLQAQEVEVSIAGSGNARVWAEESLEVSIVGSGDVYYKGRPLVDSSSTGSGSTRPL